MFCRISLVGLALLSGCAGAMPEGRWPSLARRPGEMVQTAAAAAPVEPPAATVAAVSAAAGPQLATIERDLAALDKRWRAQAVTTRGAVAAARGAAAESERWSDAQVELSRLEQIGAQLGDMRSRLDGVAGDLAASDGSAESLRRVGALITRLEGLRAEHRTAFAEGNAGLPR